MAFQRKKPAAIGVKVRFPGFIESALATSISRVPAGDRWIHEMKFDGYRVPVHLVNEAVKVFTRRGNDGQADPWAVRRTIFARQACFCKSP